MKKKCLLLLPRPIFPPVCGYALKNKNLVRILSMKYELMVVAITESGIGDEEKAYYRDLGVSCMEYKISIIKSLFQCFLGLFSDRPLQVCYYYDKELQEKICRFSETQDILISALIRTREYLTGLEQKKTVVFDMVDSIALNYERSRKSTRSGFWKLLYGLEGKRLRVYEQKYIERSSVTYLFNQEEQVYWEKYGNVKLLPHGADEKLFSYRNRSSEYAESVVFLGKMNYQPNVDAILWYMKNVHPRIKDKVPLLIVGAYPTKEICKCAEEIGNVTVTGLVEDPYFYANSALAMIAPMQTGGGIQNKVLEGMALGKVNVVSSLAAKPILGTENMRNIIIADTPDSYVQILSEMAESSGSERNNPEKYEKIGRAARELIQNNYTWEKYGEKYIEGIEESENTMHE